MMGAYHMMQLWSSLICWRRQSFEKGSVESKFTWINSSSPSPKNSVEFATSCNNKTYQGVFLFLVSSNHKSKVTLSSHWKRACPKKNVSESNIFCFSQFSRTYCNRCGWCQILLASVKEDFWHAYACQSPQCCCLSLDLLVLM